MLCTLPRTRREDGSTTENCKKLKRSSQNQHAALKSKVAPTKGKGPFSSRTLARVHPPTAPCLIGHGTRWPGSRSNPRHNHHRWRRHVGRERPLLPWPRGFAVRHYLEDLDAQFLWVGRTIATQLTVHPQAVTSTPNAPVGRKLCALYGRSSLPSAGARHPFAPHLHYRSTACHATFWGASSSYWVSAS